MATVKVTLICLCSYDDRFSERLRVVQITLVISVLYFYFVLLFIHVFNFFFFSHTYNWQTVVVVSCRDHTHTHTPFKVIFRVARYEFLTYGKKKKRKKRKKNYCGGYSIEMLTHSS